LLFRPQFAIFARLFWFDDIASLWRNSIGEAFRDMIANWENSLVPAVLELQFQEN